MNNRCGGGKKDETHSSLALLPLFVPARRFTCPPNEGNDRFMCHNDKFERFSRIMRDHVCKGVNVSSPLMYK